MEEQYDEGVSATIGIILLVAITFVLSAFVFIIVSDLGQDRDLGPNVAFRQNGNQFTVITTPEVAITWGELNVNCDGTLSGLDDAAEEVNAGDSFSCTGDAAVAHEPSDSLLYDFER